MVYSIFFSISLLQSGHIAFSGLQKFSEVPPTFHWPGSSDHLLFGKTNLTHLILWRTICLKLRYGRIMHKVVCLLSFACHLVLILYHSYTVYCINLDYLVISALSVLMPACSRLAASLLRIPSSPLKSSSPLLCTSSRRFHRVYSKPSISALDRTEMDSNIGNSRRKDVLKIFRTAISSVLPQQMLQNVLHIENDVLHVEDREYPLNNNVHIVGFGKAVAGMARVVEEKLGPHIVQGIVSIPHGLQATLTELGKRYIYYMYIKVTVYRILNEFLAS